MEWVETTAKSLEDAKELALDRLGVAADEAEFEILEEPRAGLFGRMRGEARVRARVMPTAVRPKQDRRRSRNKGEGRGKRSGGRQSADAGDGQTKDTPATDTPADDTPAKDTPAKDTPAADGRANESRPKQASRNRRSNTSKQKEQQVNTDDSNEAGDRSDVTPADVGAAAEAFMVGLAESFGVQADASVEIDGTDIDVRVTGSGLGLMVGHGGRTLLAIQDLARVASQRRLGDHETRLRIDVAGYREKRREALERFAVAVAKQVAESGEPKALEPMQSADRKIVHDVLAGVDGVTSRSEGDDPMRRVVISPD